MMDYFPDTNTNNKKALSKENTKTDGFTAKLY